MLELHFGTGGEDAKNFVNDLVIMYKGWAALNSLSFEELDDSTRGHSLLRISGGGARKAFENESGSHCVQRYPDNDRGGRRHTSIVSVAVLPVPKEADLSPLPENELTVETKMGSGPGGQYRNSTESAVRMTHKPTGLQVYINARDQKQNRRQALRILTAKVHQQRIDAQKQEYARQRRERLGDGSRGSKLRTYRLHDRWVIDSRLGVKTRMVDKVLSGHLELLFNQR